MRSANTFDWIEIRVQDAGRSASFFEALFGWKIQDREKAGGRDYWIFDTGDDPRSENLRRGGMWAVSEGGQPGVVVYIVTDDIEAVLEKVPRLGGTVVSPRTAQGAAFKAYFKDPSGNLFGLWEERSVA